ncbi:MAG: polymorphic toxin type 50 domain-containing protein [Peptococcaceae bacterium]|nr:polymorphic toxin type 50 domain-containing protein [Peptococcaceae bacterium]
MTLKGLFFIGRFCYGAIGLSDAFHVYCRSITAPYYEDLAHLGTRAARDPETGKTIRVPRDMTYKEWYAKFVEPQEEMAYNKLVEEVHARIASDYPQKIKQGLQNKHIRGTKEFDPKRSELTADPQELMERYFNTSEPVIPRSGKWRERSRFVHSEEIGIWRDEAGNEAPTKRGTIHYSKNGIHIIPGRPQEGD